MPRMTRTTRANATAALSATNDGGISEGEGTDSETEENQETRGKKMGFTPVSGKSKRKYVCKGGDKTCGQILTKSDESIKCDTCDNWFHPKCQDLEIEAFDAIAKFNLFWVCHECKPKMRSMVEAAKSFETKVEQVERNLIRAISEVVPKTDEKISSMEKSVVNQLKEKLCVVESSLSEQKDVVKSLPKYTTDLKNSAKELKKFVQDKDEQQNRAQNVIIHNIPECESASPDERKEYNEASFQNIVGALYGEDETMEIERVFRLGKKADSTNSETARPRLMLVKLRKKECVDLLMKKRLKLKDVGFSNVYITRDLPPEEREAQKQLRQELAEKGKDTHRIFRGKVVPRE